MRTRVHIIKEGNRQSYDDMKYNFAEDEKLRAILKSIIAFTSINIEIIGCWI